MRILSSSSTSKQLLLPVLGVEKYELLAKQAGIEDPFFLKSF